MYMYVTLFVNIKKTSFSLSFAHGKIHVHIGNIHENGNKCLRCYEMHCRNSVVNASGYV
jgi:hypothetical protein